MMMPSSVSAEISSVARKRFALDDQRMVARGGEMLRQSLRKIVFAVVMDFAGFAVHHFGRANHLAAECRADGLMAEANAEDWNFSCEALDQRRR